MIQNGNTQEGDGMSAQNNVMGFMRRDDAAAYLSVSPRTVSEWQRKRIIPHVKAGRKCILFRRADLDRAMERLTIQAIGAGR